MPVIFAVESGTAGWLLLWETRSLGALAGLVARSLLGWERSLAAGVGNTPSGRERSPQWVCSLPVPSSYRWHFGHCFYHISQDISEVTSCPSYPSLLF